MKYSTILPESTRCEECSNDRALIVTKQRSRDQRTCLVHQLSPTYDEMIVKHSKLIGFLESRLKVFLGNLIDYLGCSENILLDARGPYAESALESFFLISLPIERLDDLTKSKVATAFMVFDNKLGQMFEIGGWQYHSSEYEIISREDLPHAALEGMLSLLIENRADMQVDV
jgi:hypothetical protein